MAAPCCLSHSGTLPRSASPLSVELSPTMVHAEAAAITAPLQHTPSGLQAHRHQEHPASPLSRLLHIFSRCSWRTIVMSSASSSFSSMSCPPLLLLVVALLVLMAHSCYAGDNLITDGGFESGAFAPAWKLGDQGIDITTKVVRCAFPNGFGCHSGKHYALFSSVYETASLTQTVTGLTSGEQYDLSFWLAGAAVLESLGVVVSFDGQPGSTVEATGVVFGSSPYTLYSATVTAPVVAPGAAIDVTITFDVYQFFGGFGLDDVKLVANSKVVGDPVFYGFSHQFFRMTGIPGRVFNLVSMPGMQVNARFKALKDGESMSAAMMKQIRASQDVVAASSMSPYPAPPRTTAYNHPGTYLGEVGIKLGGFSLYVAPGGYLQGFSNVSMNGVAVPLSGRCVTITAGVCLLHPSPHVVRIVSAEISFSLVNADYFVNIESASAPGPYNPDRHMDGLLGQTADPNWKVKKTAEWRHHLEYDHLLPTDDLFSDDTARHQHSEK